ncbi:MAG: pyridoxal-phosphate dependent enzyme [Candidatus Aenigmarchaeota archaeon]|nr:pyridoxal-phosphate dependent enzyme [Candidatus Aenigmarchaeota archaeon]MDI6722099.1 pyridoxal-phosphate dependent enzyme [Candidatus Aenigmarchaeota archaeon]
MATPLECLRSENGVAIYAKREDCNPTGSIKYRVANHLIEAAEKNDNLGPGSKIIEESSGNTGIALAFLSRGKYETTIIVSEEGCTKEARSMIKRYGGNVIPVKGWVDERQALIRHLLNEDLAYYWTHQASNLAMLLSSFSLGKEILDQLPQIDFYLACTGTCATITGVGLALKEKNPATQVIAVVPERDFGFSGVDDFRMDYPKPLLVRNIIDRVYSIEDEKPIRESQRRLLDEHDHFVGFSSAAVFYAADGLAEKLERKGERGNILIIYADSGDRYYSMLDGQ